VKESVVGFGHPLANEIMRQVAIVADCDVMVAGVLPSVEMILHHMTIDTCLGIVAQIACPFSVAKREYSNAHKYAKTDC